MNPAHIGFEYPVIADLRIWHVFRYGIDQHRFADDKRCEPERCAISTEPSVQSFPLKCIWIVARVDAGDAYSDSDFFGGWRAQMGGLPDIETQVSCVFRRNRNLKHLSRVAG